MIDKLQIILNEDQDTVIARACEMLYKRIRPKNNIETKWENKIK